MKISNKAKIPVGEAPTKNPSPQSLKASFKSTDDTKKDLSQDSKCSFLEISSILADSRIDNKILQEAPPQNSLPIFEAPLMSNQ